MVVFETEAKEAKAVNCNENILNSADSVNLEKELENSKLKVMALKTNLLSQIGGTVQFGKRADVFWIAMAILATGVLIASSLFGKKKRRR